MATLRGMPQPDPEALLRDLDPEQLEAVRLVSGPVVIHAGAGSGKTRVISRRTAYAIATEAVPADQVLVVTFTDKAATEMVERLRVARAARRHGADVPRPRAEPAAAFLARAATTARRCPAILANKRGLIVDRLARQLPGHYQFTPSKDLADEIELGEGAADRARDATRSRPRRAEREPPIPVDLFVRVFGDYERTKARVNRIDFDDLLARDRRPARDRRGRRPRRSARGSAGSASTSTRTRTRSSSGSWSCGSAIARTCASSATRTRRSTRSPARPPTT